MKKKIVITEFMDAAAVEILKGCADVRYDPALVNDLPRLMAEVRDADAVIVRNVTQVRGELLAGIERAQVIGRLGVGLDNIDVAACEARGIRVIPATGANARSVAEYVIGTALVLLRGRALLSTDAVAAGQWPRAALSSGREVGGKTLGLIGFGGIGRLTAALAHAVGMSVVAYDPMLTSTDGAWTESGVKPLPLDALLAEADVVSLHIPLTPETRGLLSAERIAQMKKNAILINSARGAVADEPAVAAALKSGHLGGAAFDVFEHEPLAAGNPWVGCPNLILTPHVAGVTVEANTRVSLLIAQEVTKALGL